MLMIKNEKIVGSIVMSKCFILKNSQLKDHNER